MDSVTSNNGHLLWSGIVDKTKAKAVVRHLMGERLFSGWGVRTLAVGEGRYNPIGYHVGTIWPFDNSFIAWGLRRYGFQEEAAQVAAGILEAAEFFDGRLPEAFGGYPRSMTKYPVRCRPPAAPQAWSTGAPLRRWPRCWAWSRLESISWSIPPCPGPSAVSSCWTFPVAGAASTPSPAAASTTSAPARGRPGR